MTILALDPGTRNLGFAVLRGKRILASGTHRFARHPFGTRIREIGPWALRDSCGPTIRMVSSEASGGLAAQSLSGSRGLQPSLTTTRGLANLHLAKQ